MNRKISLWVFALVLAAGQAVAQQPLALDPVKYHVFDMDSLSGFDDAAARTSAITEGFVGDEFPVRMYQLKRRYINDKYNLWKPVKHTYVPASAMRSQVVPACVNEDFEAATAGTITVSNQVQGWTVTRGLNQGQNNNSCNLNGCCDQAPAESAIFDAPNGIIDAKIGPCYPIYSVFGDGLPNSNAAAANPHVEIPMKGTKFIRINSDNNNYSIEKLSKTFSVTPQNALFQFAFIAVFSPGHGCCDAGAFKISLPGFPCPTFSASAPSGACPSNMQFYSIPSTGSTVQPCAPYDPNTTFGVQYIFTKWQVSSMDLTAYIGSNITIEIVATDCTAGGHFGYVYFDAQCGPMSILGNGTPFPAGSTNVTIPTCGPNGATICATPGLGPYSWAGPNIPPGYSTPSYSNQCFTTSVSATYTLYMDPPGSCASFTRVVHTTVTPAPTMIGSVIQAQCGGTLAVVSVTTGGSAGNPKFIEWYPTPLSLNSNTTQAQYVIPPTGQPTMVVTIIASDQIGCPVSLTLGVNPPAPIPDFTIGNVTGTPTITCTTPTINLQASTNYTYGPYNYFWSNPSFTSAAASVTLTQPGMYVLRMEDAVSKCFRTDTIHLGIDNSAPTSALSHTFQTISCVSSAVVMTLTAESPTVNVKHTIFDPMNGTYSDNGTSFIYAPGAVGVYTYVLQNQLNGCKTTKNFTIFSNDGFPTFTLTSQRNYTIGCNAMAWADVNITNAQASPGNPGAVSYSLLLPTSGSVSPNPGSTVASYTVFTPGNYTVITRNSANGCETRLPISILTNTVPPTIDTIIAVSPILTCFTPSVLLKGISTSPSINYNWKLPPNLTKPGDVVTIEADFTRPTETVVGTYTLEVDYIQSTCMRTETIMIAQNLFQPIGVITGMEVFLTCRTNSVTLTNSSDYNPASPYPHPKGISGLYWTGPSPQIPKDLTTNYVAYYPGIYTMIARDENNGCMDTVTAEVIEDREYPVLNNPTAPPQAVLDCGASSATVFPTISTSTVDLDYFWSTVNSLGTPTFVGGSETTQSLVVTNTGTFAILVVNRVNGCQSEAQMSVIPGFLTVNFNADKMEGFAPLTVAFENLSTSSLGSASIQSVWSFGNGEAADTTTAMQQTTYSQPGTYTVMLIAGKGSCIDTAFAVISVDIPSEMIVPNVFTPNNDGVNDVYHLQRSSNLTQIKAAIYDRWGNKVYEVDSPTGQIEWDGTNQFGKQCPQGTYYFIITATGRDGKAYDEKGTLSLIR